VAFRVLIVDDNRLFLEAARVLLERQGLSVVGVASTTAEALSQAEKLQPALVLVDIRLAEESGFELARDLTEQDCGGGTAVILISTHAEADFADLIAESPARGFLAKSEVSAGAIGRILDGHSLTGAFLAAVEQAGQTFGEENFAVSQCHPAAGHPHAGYTPRLPSRL
jgi:DNA-binding NarL/FixJ family response regulator